MSGPQGTRGGPQGTRAGRQGTRGGPQCARGGPQCARAGVSAGGPLENGAFRSVGVPRGPCRPQGNGPGRPQASPMLCAVPPPPHRALPLRRGRYHPHPVLCVSGPSPSSPVVCVFDCGHWPGQNATYSAKSVRNGVDDGLWPPQGNPSNSVRALGRVAQIRMSVHRTP